jgi:hypothetical protein
MVVYRLSYLITCTCFVNENESAYASSFFSCLLITGNRRHVDSKKKNVTCKLFLFFSYGTAISHASIITIIRDSYLNTRFFYFFTSFRHTVSAFIHSFSTQSILVNYLTVTITSVVYPVRINVTLNAPIDIQMQSKILYSCVKMRVCSVCRRNHRCSSQKNSTTVDHLHSFIHSVFTLPPHYLVTSLVHHLFTSCVDLGPVMSVDGWVGMCVARWLSGNVNIILIPNPHPSTW